MPMRCNEISSYADLDKHVVEGEPTVRLLKVQPLANVVNSERQAS